MATEQTITISGTPTVVSGVTVPYVNTSDLEVYIGKGKIESIEVTNAGAGYTNYKRVDGASKALVFSGGSGGSSTTPTHPTDVFTTVGEGNSGRDSGTFDAKWYVSEANNADQITFPVGSNYTTAPNISLENFDGGTGAQLTAKIYAKKELTTDYTLSGTSGNTTITFTSALADEDKVLIKRVTGVSTAANTFAAGSAITAEALNKSFDQIRYKVEELPTITNTAVTDGRKDDIEVSGSNWTIINDAVTSAKIADNAVDGDKLADNITIAGNLTTDGNTILNGNIDLGDATGDTISFVGRVDTDIVPSSDGERDLGASGLEFKDLYIDGTANIDSLVADTADINSGTIDGTSIAGSTGSFTSLSASEPCTFTKDVDADSSTSGGTVTITGGLAVSKKAFIGGDFSVNTNKVTMTAANGNTAIAGTLAVSDNTSVAAGKTLTAGGPLIFSPTTLTIGTAAITVTGTYHTIIGEGSANDALGRIESNPTAVAGQLLILQSHEDDEITIHDSYASEGVTGNIKLSGANEIIEGTKLDVITFLYTGSQWVELSRWQES